MPGKNKKILIVDDAPQNIAILNEILKPYYALQAATSGPAALSICRSDSPPDLLLLDIMMPGMDGFEVARQLQSSKRTRKIPIVFVTAKNEIESRLDAYESGATNYITKPFEENLVLKIARKHLAGK
jgi:CheY-like chemotaxis protein